MTDNGDMSLVGKALLDFSSKFLLPIVLAFVTWQYTEIRGLETRVNDLQLKAVTHAELQIVEARWGGMLDLRIKNLAENQKITNDYLKILIDQKRAAQ